MHISRQKFEIKIKYQIISTLFILLFLLSCSKGGGGFGGGYDSANSSANVVIPNPNGNNQNYLLIGAKGRNGTGSVYRCSLDGDDCIEIFGGLAGYISATNLTLKQNDSFGSSIGVNDNSIYIGALNKSGFNAANILEQNNPNGAVYKCDLSGLNCSIIDSSSLKLITNDNFGTSIFATNDSIFIGAIGRDGGTPAQSNLYDMGSLFKCDADGTKCIEIMGGKNQTNQIRKDLNGFDNFASSIYLTNSSLYIGAKNKNGGNGRVFKCKADGSNCVQFDISRLNLITNDNFGYSIAGSDKNIFVGAIGRDSGPTNKSDLYDTGAVFRCDFDGKNCSEIYGGQNQKSFNELKLGVNDNFGSALAVYGNYIYVGAVGRKDETGKRTGSVFRCKLEPGKDNDKQLTDCIELIAGRTHGVNKARILGLKEGDSFGSSITVATLPMTETGFILQDIYKVIGKNSDSLIDGLSTANFTVQLSVLCDGMNSPNSQILSKQNLIIKLSYNKNCTVTVDSLTINNEIFSAVSPAPLSFKIGSDKKISSPDEAAIYTSSLNANKYYMNVASEKIGTFHLGLTDVQNRFKGNNFKFVAFDLTYDGKGLPIILDKSSLFTTLLPPAQSVGFVLPNAKQDKFHTITWGGDTGKEQSTLKVKVYNPNVVDGYDVTLIGNSVPQNCPTYANWPLTSAVAINCGADGKGNNSKGFIIKFLPNLNENLPEGNYFGTLYLQAINWHDLNVFQNMLINLNITIPKK